MVKAIVCHETGGPEVMKLTDITVGAPGAGEIKLRQTIAGVNFIDTYHRSGLYKMPIAHDTRHGRRWRCRRDWRWRDRP